MEIAEDLRNGSTRDSNAICVFDVISRIPPRKSSIGVPLAPVTGAKSKHAVSTIHICGKINDLCREDGVQSFVKSFAEDNDLCAVGSLFDRPEVKNLLSFLLLIVDKLPIGLLRVANIDAFRLKLSDVTAIVDHLREHSDKQWFENRASLPVGGDAKASLDALVSALAGFDVKSNRWNVLAKLLFDRTRLAAGLATSTKVSERSGGIAIWQFMNFVRSQPASEGLPVRRLLDRVRRLARIGDDRDLGRPPAAAMSLNAVKLMTIHGAKGLEFPVVHLLGLNQDTFPGPCSGRSQLLPPNGMIFGATGDALSASRQGETEERECLFYVAASRAQERLFLYAITKKSNGSNRPLSPYLDSFGGTLKQSDIAPSRVLAPPVTSEAVEVISAGRVPFTVSEVSVYTKCPRRFLYTYLIRIGGHRVEAGYMRMHEAVRAVVQDVVKNASVVDADDAALTQAITDAFKREELDDPEAIVELHDAALKMLRYFHATRPQGRLPCRAQNQHRRGRADVPA